MAEQPPTAVSLGLVSAAEHDLESKIESLEGHIWQVDGMSQRGKAFYQDAGKEKEELAEARAGLAALRGEQ